MEWECVEKPAEQWLRSDARQNKGEERSPEGQSAVQSEKPFTHEQHTATS